MNPTPAQAEPTAAVSKERLMQNILFSARTFRPEHAQRHLNELIDQFVAQRVAAETAKLRKALETCQREAAKIINNPGPLPEGVMFIELTCRAALEPQKQDGAAS